MENLTRVERREYNFGRLSLRSKQPELTEDCLGIVTLVWLLRSVARAGESPRCVSLHWV